MNINRYTIHNMLNFSISGNGRLLNYFKYQYNAFGRNENDTKLNNVNITFKNKINLILKKELNDSDNIYGIDDNEEYFVWSHRNKKVLFYGNKPLSEQLDLVFDSNFNNMQANLAFDLFIRLKAVNQQIALIHAASVEKNNKVHLITAWKSMGKTATCLKLIDKGYSFLGDDRVWISSEGTILNYPRYIVLKNSNEMFFPQFISLFTKIKNNFYKFLEKFTLVKNHRVLKLVFQKLFGMKAQYFYINELYPNAEIKQKGKLDTLIYLTKDNRDDIEFKTINKETILNNVINIGNIEWNYSLLELASAHDILFPSSPRWVDEIKKLMDKEKEIIQLGLQNSKYYHCNVPQNDTKVNWNKLVQEVNKL